MLTLKTSIGMGQGRCINPDLLAQYALIEQPQHTAMFPHLDIVIEMLDICKIDFIS